MGVLEVGGLGKELLRVLTKRLDGLAEIKELPFGVAHQRHEDAALPSALAAKSPHDLCQLLLQMLGLAPQEDGAAVASLRKSCNALKSFFEP